MYPPISSESMRELDRLTSEEFGLPSRLLMELAGAGAAAAILRRLQDGEVFPPVVVACGRGNNGGDGFVVARHLASADVPVRVLAMVPPEGFLPGDAFENGRILPAYGVQVLPWSEAGLESAGLIVDALLGTGLKGPPRGPILDAVVAIEGCRVPALALDLPSGLCGDTGRVLGAAVRARWTVTFGFLKRGLLEGEGPSRSGEVEVVRLPYPRAAVERVLRGRSDR